MAAIEHPFGRPFGDVGDATTQEAVLRATLAIFENVHEPGGVEHLDFTWHEDPRKTRWHPPQPASCQPRTIHDCGKPGPGSRETDRIGVADGA